MTIMKDTSIEAASKWIKNKNIEVFEKKLLFFPINADSHWSLGVVVNPGLIENSFDNDSNPDEEIAL
jgi:Ulp1 family protease